MDDRVHPANGLSQGIRVKHVALIRDEAVAELVAEMSPDEAARARNEDVH
jgi:hypothetical protein